MDVVGHDGPPVKPVSLAVEMQERIFDHICDARIQECLRAVAGIERRLDPCSVFSRCLVIWKMGKFLGPSFEQGRGQAVS
jgi:hypothetical protein